MIVSEKLLYSFVKQQYIRITCIHLPLSVTETPKNAQTKGEMKMEFMNIIILTEY
jgi:hypothetical protein